MANYTRCRGTLDIYDKQASLIQKVERACQKIAHQFHYSYIQTPMFESSELFTRSSGETSDIVTKEMYTFLDKGNRSITLRPEGTAGVIRAIIENKLYATNDLPLKYYYSGSFFRYERPQAGRYREFMQFGVEVVGTQSYLDDVETILFIVAILKELNLNEYTIKMNSFGNEICKNRYRDTLKNYFWQFKEQLCEDCQTRLQVNPLRVLDCKVDHDFFKTKEIPTAVSCLDAQAQEEFALVQKILTQQKVPYIVDHQLVRGLDYYTGLIFEIDIQAVDGKVYTIGGGGHYSNLVKELGGPDLSCVGFGLGINRLALILQEQYQDKSMDTTPSIYIMPLCEDAIFIAMDMAKQLREHDYVVTIENGKKSVSSMFKYASKKQFSYAIVIGENEINAKKVNLKNMQTQQQEMVAVDEVLNVLRG